MNVVLVSPAPGSVSIQITQTLCLPKFFQENHSTPEDKFSILDPEMENTQSPLHSFMGFNHTNHSSYGMMYGSGQSYYQNSWNNMGVEFRIEPKDMDESEECSPPLWTTSPSRNSERRINHYRSLSPASRTQVITRGQQQLMEMVKNMPESYYELSLRDLVEQPLVGEQKSEPEERSFKSESSYGMKENISNRKKFDNKAQIKRSGNIDSGGFYIKMAFPNSFGSKKKKNSKRYDQIERNNISPKGSPRASVSDRPAKGVERDWWNKSFSGSGNSESGVSSMNSGSTKSTASNSSGSSNNSRHKNGGCWFFIRKSKPQVQNDN